MKRGLTPVYTIVTVVFFLAVAAVILFRLGAAREENLSNARDLFQRTQAEIVQNAGDSELPISRIVQRAFRDAASESTRTVAFAAYGVEENVEYLWARNRSYVDGASRESRQLRYDELSQTLLSSSVRLPGGDPIMVEGVYNVLDRRDVFGLLRDALIAVLAFALIAVILAIVGLVRPRSPRESPAARPQPEKPYSPEPYPDNAARAGQSEVRTGPGEARGAPPQPPESGPAHQETEKNAPASSSAPDSTTAAAKETAGGGIDTGLFSPQSGLSPEAHLEKRLSLELERAAANDQDLSICFVEFPGVMRGTESYRTVAAVLLEFFGFEDLIFEYGKSSFCLLFPNVELNETIQHVEDFQHRLLAGQLGSQAEEASVPKFTEEPYFGISSRNGRLVEGGRMMREARQALQKAKETVGHVMAFKPDPHKYRQFISKQGG